MGIVCNVVTSTEYHFCTKAVVPSFPRNAMFLSTYHCTTKKHLNHPRYVSRIRILFEGMMTSSSGNIFRVTGPLCGEFSGHRGFDVFFDLRLHKQLNKQLWGWWFETPSRSLWRNCNGVLRNHGCKCMILVQSCWYRVNSFDVPTTPARPKSIVVQWRTSFYSWPWFYQT